MAKILLVEDYLKLREELVEVFEEEGHTVFAQEGIGGAFLLFQKEQIDLCILDVGLRDGNGFDLCEKIRKHSQVPIIMLTASSEEGNVLKGFQLGADDYIKKPFRLKELLARVQVQLKRHTQEAPEDIKSGDLVFDTQQHKIFQNGKEVAVTPIEFELCLRLIRGKGKVLNRDLLIEVICGSTSSYIIDNTLTVYLSRLRKKLGKHQDTHYIETVRGYGYRWSVSVYEK